MNNLLKTLVFLALLQAGSLSAQHYLFFLHGRIVEEQGAHAVSPEHGPYEYTAILDSLRRADIVVMSEVRAKNTDAHKYAKYISEEVTDLLEKGVPASHITVVGTSKGGYIAMYVSTLLKNKDLNFVFIGCCQQALDTSVQFCGNILSIYEQSDEMGKSCQQLKQYSTREVPHFKEMIMHTGLKHGFLYKPLPEWTNAAVQWALGNYK